MKKSKRCEVAAALSRYWGISETELFRGLKLERDLGILSLNLVLLALEFEDAEGFGFPFERLDSVTTVGELIDLVSGWLVDARKFGERDFRLERARPTAHRNRSAHVSATRSPYLRSERKASTV